MGCDFGIKVDSFKKDKMRGIKTFECNEIYKEFGVLISNNCIRFSQEVTAESIHTLPQPR